MTMRARRLRFCLATTSPLLLAFALTLVVPAQTASQTATKGKKQRQADATPGRELEAKRPDALERPSGLLVRTRPAELAAPKREPETAGLTPTPGLSLTERVATYPVVRGFRRTDLPLVVPPFPCPASPIR